MQAQADPPSGTPADRSDASDPSRDAQGIPCGDWRLAFPYGWARCIVEHFELSEVPHAPPWLLGAANIDGQVVPVVDLVRYLQPGPVSDAEPLPAATAAVPGTALLLGGPLDDPVGLAFVGMPVRVQAVPAAPPPVPSALADYVRGCASDGAGRHWAVIDGAALADAWAAELALA